MAEETSVVVAAVASGDDEEKKIPADALSDLKEKHGEVWTVELGDDVFGIVVPSSVEYDRFMSAVAADRAKAPSALRTLAKTVVVYPPQAEFWALVKRRPGLPSRLGNEALKLAGAEESELAKKS